MDWISSLPSWAQWVITTLSALGLLSLSLWTKAAIDLWRHRQLRRGQQEIIDSQRELISAQADAIRILLQLVESQQVISEQLTRLEGQLQEIQRRPTFRQLPAEVQGEVVELQGTIRSVQRLVLQERLSFKEQVVREVEKAEPENNEE
jgi:DNA replicative helicase MCM subunit Mcm2 (Cdc46/Mcm family)